jgi:polyisoprenyl-phosphate glycosyltransferase
MISVIVPVYQEEKNIDRLLHELTRLNDRVAMPMETVFVVDGGTDRSLDVLRAQAPSFPFRWQIVSLSRNFGAWSAISAGLQYGRGDYFAVMAADLQEPPDLVVRFAEVLSSGRADIAIGRRERRSDPWLSRVFSKVFWSTYRRFVLRDIPPGGADVFAVTKPVRNILVNFRESSTSLVALLFWVGFRREFVPYSRAPRLKGKSAWTFAKKMRLAINSILNFSDLPLQVLLLIGALGMIAAVSFGSVVFVLRLLGRIDLPGYSALIVAIMFFGGLTSVGLGIVGQYLWLVLQNVRGRPNFIVATAESSLDLDAVPVRVAQRDPQETAR